MRRASSASRRDDRKGLKEQNRIDPPSFPQIATLERFKLDLYDRVIVCAQDKDPTKVMKWLRKVEDPKTRFDDLDDPGRGYVTLDRKLAAGLTHILSGELSRSIHNIRQALMRECKLVSGRQFLFELYRHFATSPMAGPLLGVQDLTEIRWFGDGQKQSFRNYWESQMAIMRDNIPLWMRTDTLEKAMMSSMDLKAKMMFYEQKFPEPLGEANAAERYEELIKILDVTIIRERERANQDKQQKANRKFLDQFVRPTSKPNFPAAVPAREETGQGAQERWGEKRGSTRRATKEAARRRRVPGGAARARWTSSV